MVVLTEAFTLATTAQGIVNGPTTGNTSSNSGKTEVIKKTPPAPKKSLLEQGQDAYNRKKYTQALELWKKANDAGDADALFRIGTLYEQGHGVEKDQNSAWNYYTAAALNGSKEALAYYEDDGTITDAGKQYGKGLSYYQGEEFHKAFYWYQKSAEQGYEYAETALVPMYLGGKGVVKSEELAYKYALKSTQHEMPTGNSFYFLGCFYDVGWYVAKDKEKAWECYYKAATMIPYSKDARKEFGDEGQILSNAQMNEKALEGLNKGYDYWQLYWWTKSANFGDDTNEAKTEAQYHLGGYFYNRKDYKTAVDYLTKAAKQDNSWGAKAQTLLGLCYNGGRGVTENPHKAAELFERAMKNGDWDGACYLGIMYQRNFFGEKSDQKKAFKLYEEAAKHNNRLGEALLGYCYMTGSGTSTNKKKGFEYYNKSTLGLFPCELGYYWLAGCYRFGNGCEQDLSKAEYYYKKVTYTHEKGIDFRFDFEPNLALGHMYEEQGKTNEADEAYTRTLMYAYENNDSFYEKEAEEALKRLGVPIMPKPPK